MAEACPVPRSTANELLGEIARRTPKIGSNRGAWPGMTLYRMLAPGLPHQDEMHTVSLCVIGQGRTMVTVDGEQYTCDSMHYLVLGRGTRCQAMVLDASLDRPFLAMVLRVDPVVLRDVAGEMLGSPGTAFPARPVLLGALDTNITSALVRFLRATSVGQDRRALGPMYLQEIVYRVFQAQQLVRPVELAGRGLEGTPNPISQVSSYLRARMSEPVTVAELAEHVCMSQSAFTQMFRGLTGMSPYQFVKNFRLGAAKALLAEGRLTVSEVGREVGYSTLSHFSNEFKRHYGMTPRVYAVSQRGDSATGGVPVPLS
jgi:AraC-like DNA-binding protein